MIMRSSCLPVRWAIDSDAGTSLSRRTPAGVHSYSHENSIANGNPITAAITIQRTTPPGMSKTGTSCVTTSTSNQALAA